MKSRMLPMPAASDPNANESSGTNDVNRFQSSTASSQQQQQLPTVNTSANPFGLPTTTDGVPLFTMEQLQMLHRQALLQLQFSGQHHLQQEDTSKPPIPGAAAAASSATTNKPFMVVTQVPVQATDVLRSKSSSQSNHSHEGQVIAPTIQQHSTDWADLPQQPTPFGVPLQDCQSNRPTHQNAQKQSQAIQFHYGQLAQQQQSPETLELMQTLLRNAQQASSSEQHVIGRTQLQNVAQPPLINHQESIRMPNFILGSGQAVEPLTPCEGQNTSMNDAAAVWKMFLEEDDHIMSASQRRLDSSEGSDDLEKSVESTSAVPATATHQSLSFNEQMTQFQLRAEQGSSSFAPIATQYNQTQSHPAMLRHALPKATRSSSTSKRKSSGRNTVPKFSAASSRSPPHLSESNFSVPSVYMPPSVLASVLSSPSPNPTNCVAESVVESYEKSSLTSSGRFDDESSNRARRVTKNLRLESPQHVFERIVQSRGIRFQRINSDDAGYDAPPSSLQLASFGTELVKAFHKSDVALMNQLLSSGLSPNPCNQFRDSIIDLICKRGNVAIFEVLVQHGCDLRVCDGFGRTPLHHACWASDFNNSIVNLVLQQDWLQLFIEDKRGQTPLEYVRQEIKAEWIEFLENEVAKFFPVNAFVVAPNLKSLRGDGPLPDPPNALPVQLAFAVSSGKLTVEQVRTMSPEMLAKFS